MNKRFDLSGKVALVTGASRGIGASLSAALAEQGAHVVLNTRHKQPLAEHAKALTDQGLSASIAPFDITDDQQIELAVNDLFVQRGGLDILVNNAGIMIRDSFIQGTYENFSRVQRVNIDGAYQLSRACVPMMKESGCGRIINIGSIYSQLATQDAFYYIVSKHALHGLTKGLAVELGEHGITVNTIAPGYIRTEINASLQNNKIKSTKIKQRSPLKRWGTPADLQGACIFLASEEAAFINGQLLVADGGFSINVDLS